MVLIVFAVVVYVLVAQTISQLTDNAMRSAGDALIDVINAEKDEDDEPGKSNADIFNEKIQEDFRFRDLAFVIFDEKKNVIAKGFDANDQINSQLPQFKISAKQISPEIIEKFAASSFQTFSLPDETNIKIYALKINFNGQNYIVAVLRPLAEQEQLLTKIRFIFFLVIPLVLLAVIFGGYYLARKSLAPVVEMSEKAALIWSERVCKRRRELTNWNRRKLLR